METDKDYRITTKIPGKKPETCGGYFPNGIPYYEDLGITLRLPRPALFDFMDMAAEKEARLEEERKKLNRR